MLTKMLMKIVNGMGEISKQTIAEHSPRTVLLFTPRRSSSLVDVSEENRVWEVCQWCRLQTVDAQQIRWENHDWRFTFSNVESYCKMPFGRGYRRNVASVWGFGGQGVASMQLGGGSFLVWWLSWVSSTYRMDSTQRFRGMFNNVNCVATAPITEGTMVSYVHNLFRRGTAFFLEGTYVGEIKGT